MACGFQHPRPAPAPSSCHGALVGLRLPLPCMVPPLLSYGPINDSGRHQKEPHAIAAAAAAAAAMAADALRLVDDMECHFARHFEGIQNTVLLTRAHRKVSQGRN